MPTESAECQGQDDRELITDPSVAFTQPDAGPIHHSKRGQHLLQMLQLEPSALTDEEQERLKVFILQHEDVFALDNSELGTTDLVTHTIDTGNRHPIRQPIRPTPFALRCKVDELVHEMLDQGIIQPSRSPWASPIVLVKKMDGSTRFCVNYR